MLIGIDAVDIERFKSWKSFSKKKLARIFSPEEIEYCLDNPLKSSERFATRFAAREAFYKAFAAFHKKNIPLMQVMRNVSIKNYPSGLPHLIVNWQGLGCDSGLDVNVSLSHTKTTAVAVVLISHEGNS